MIFKYALRVNGILISYPSKLSAVSAFRIYEKQGREIDLLQNNKVILASREGKTIGVRQDKYRYSVKE